MRKTVVIILFLVAFSVMGHAQQATSFRPHWSLEGQAGVSYTFGEGSFTSMLSPAFSVNVGYHFSAPLEIRLGVGGLSGKGYVPSLAQYYQYDYVRGQADLIFHSFGNFYTLVGAGVIVGINNGAQQLDAEKVSLVWKAPRAFATGRFGVGYRIPVGKSIAITTEAVYHLLPDALNSVHNGVPGGNVQLLAGVHFSFGSKAKKADTPKDVTPAAPPKRDYAAEARAAVEARAAAERAEAERKAAEKERFEAEKKRLEAERESFEAEQERQVVESARRVSRRVEEENQVVETATESVTEAATEVATEAVPEVTAEQLAEALSKAVAEAAGISDVRIYFESNSWTVQSQYEPDLQKVASFLKENKDYSVILTAYCDSRYGTAEYNKQVSERRANAVAKFLKKEGVEAAQILIRPAGGIDTYSKGENVKKNRFVVCEIVK